MPPLRPTPAHVLVVDDDPGLLRLVQKTIRRTGNEASSAQSGAGAMEELRKKRPDLMLLDLKLPDAEGPELIQRLEREDLLVPFIVITGQGDERVAVEMMKRGASDYLVKDSDFLEVLPAILERTLAQIATEKRLAEAEDQVRLVQAAVEQSRDGILINDTTSPEPRVLYINAACRRIFALGDREVVGKKVNSVAPLARLAFFQRALAEEVAAAGEATVRDADGLDRILECQITPLRDDAGVISQWVSVHRDITLRKVAEKALTARVRQQAAVAHLGKKVLAGANLDSLLRDIAHILVQALDVDFSKLLELTPAGDKLLLRSGAGWRPGAIGKATIPVDSSPQGMALATMAPVIIRDLPNDTRFKAPTLLTEHGVTSSMTVPIYDRHRPYGIIGVDTRAARHFTEDDIHFLQSLANVISEAIERRRAEKEILEVSGREQQRIGQDLHDGLGQHLAGIELLSHVLEEDLAENNLPQAAQAAKIAEHVRGAIAQTRMLARGLFPVQLEKEGLMAALQELTSSVESLFKVRCSLECNEPVHVKEHARAIHLYRIAQEAINNAIKHGKARHIVVTLRKTRGKRVLEIRDDGKGMVPGTDSGGMGLRIMNHRAAMIGARLTIRSTKAKGVKVTCTLEN
jgi:PAS domain S-box-containing protein